MDERKRRGVAGEGGKVFIPRKGSERLGNDMELNRVMPYLAT